MTREPILAVEPVADWRSGESYAALAGIDRAGLMWEWLRRDPAYRRHALAARRREMISTQMAGVEVVPAEQDALGWGLCFRGKSRSVGAGCAHPAVRRRRSWRAARRGRLRRA